MTSNEPSRGPGRPPNPRREFWIAEYNLPRTTADKLTTAFLDQLGQCKSPEAQRLILGVSK